MQYNPTWDSDEFLEALWVMTGSVFTAEPVFVYWLSETTEAEKQLKRNSESSRCDSQRVGMAAPRPIKGILKNKNSGTNVKSLPDEVSGDAPEQAPGLSEDDQQ